MDPASRPGPECAKKIVRVYFNRKLHGHNDLSKASPFSIFPGCVVMSGTPFSSHLPSSLATFSSAKALASSPKFR
jgi:hypothetical protein